MPRPTKLALANDRDSSLMTPRMLATWWELSLRDAARPGHEHIIRGPSHTTQNPKYSPPFAAHTAGPTGKTFAIPGETHGPLDE